MSNNEKARKDRFKLWVDSTGLTKQDLALKLGVSRTTLYEPLNKGVIPPILYEALLREYPETDFNWLIRGTSSGNAPLPQSNNEPVSKIEKLETGKIILERDLIKAQTRAAEALESLAAAINNLVARMDAQAQ